MTSETVAISLRVPKVLAEAAEREALRMNRSRHWVLIAWLESGYLELMPAGVDRNGVVK